VAFNTTLAAVAAGMAALLIGYARTKIWDLGLTVNGFLGGLVAITAPCYWVDPFGAFIIGAVAAAVVILLVEALEHARIDDPIGAVPVHMGCGIWGTLALGLFANGQFGVPSPTGADTSSVVTGLFYGGGATQLVSQLIGSVSITGVTLVVSFVLMKAVNATRTLRISAQGELVGIDIHEHGAVAYPEYAHVPSDRHPLSIPGVKLKQAPSATKASVPVSGK
jgi:Amt family ammonium transporter